MLLDLGEPGRRVLRNADAELARFCSIAMGSASELKYHLLLARDLKLLTLTQRNLSGGDGKGPAASIVFKSARALPLPRGEYPKRHGACRSMSASLRTDRRPGGGRGLPFPKRARS